MVDFSDTTSRQQLWLTSRAYELMKKERVEACNCGDGERGHSPDCAGELDLERRYSIIIERLREEMPSDADLREEDREAECETAEAEWFEEASYGRD